ncbi:RecA-superfamily ATPase [Halapricum desulfuricans]|uniref:RecA-superfamily ATPase n=1 Tax=Halapricum desulfuricans TaxID=2841257 RepID=A0A897NLJ3_9EURY|nr:ATPase domain-containing protein [Halapricum desulfuricans]QSG11086.1 RecA-superfamily ATPase [Halapricum desulfuricans]
MEYTLAIDNAPETIPGGTGILLVHPSTGETDRIDTEFLGTDTDHMLIVSTRTSAREVEQKLEHYAVDESKATILDTLSVERGYTRRQADHIRYVTAPDNLEEVVEKTRQFLEETEGKRRISVDSVTEMAYYADEDSAREAVEDLLALLVEYDAVGLFHLAEGVHDEEVLAGYRDLFDGTIDLTQDGTVYTSF